MTSPSQPTPARPWTLAAACIVSLSLGGCATLVNDQPSRYQHPVAPVMTEHSQALMCLGQLIERSGRPALTVLVEGVPDTTVPRNFEDRRLSHGGQWLLHTAIHRLGTDRVSSVTEAAGKAALAGHHIVLSGAWTQDDGGVGKAGAEGGLARKTASSFFDFGLGTRRRVDVIAGDFLSSRQGRVLHASAISLALGNSDSGLRLKVEDGANSFGIDMSQSASEGPQFAQRRIAEAAVLVHVSRAFGVDYRPCVESAWAAPATHEATVRGYAQMSDAERHKAVQQALTSLGHHEVAADGVWGERSARALMRFQVQHGLPVSGRHTAEVYAHLLRQTAAGKE